MGAGAKILVVDDDDFVSGLIGDVLQPHGYVLRMVSTAAAARQALDAADYDAVILDMYLPDGNGIEMLRYALDREPKPPVLMITAQADVRGAVEAMRQGAADYIAKPFDASDLVTRLERALSAVVARRKLSFYEERDQRATASIVASPALKGVFATASRLAATPSSSALILGESGVGKEVLASFIHAESQRRDGPLVSVNLAAISESMIEAELFGSIRGAFTDSKKDRAGLFASAEGGTLLLDELCEFKPELQPKLLRALEERRFFPVGSDRERRMNVRILAATNRDPQAAIANGTLRADLYYRLATVVLRVPPLRDRVEDILPLAEHFLTTFRAEFGRPGLQLSSDAQDVLLAYQWPGNVRELRNVIERAAMLAPASTIGPADMDLPVKIPSNAPTTLQPGSLEAAERDHVARALVAANGSRTKAATALGISRTTLWDKMKRYGMS